MGFNCMNKICFIEPPYGQFIESLDAPFSLMYLAAVAEQSGWEAQILDMHDLKDPLPEADVYAVTSSSPQWPITIKLADRLATERPEALSIIGGNHVSAEPTDAKQSKFDLIVIGEGEIPLKRILSTPEAFKDDPDKFIIGERIANLDEIPFPARHLIDWSKYKRGIYWGKQLLSPAVSIISSRGCPHNCVFCGSHVVFGRTTRFRSVANVVAEVEQVIAELGYYGFNFHDDTFCLHRQRVIDLCREFSGFNIFWRCLTRADTLDESLLQEMLAGGCRELLLGVESGSDKVLKRIQKGTTAKQNLKAMKMIKKSGIQLKAAIMIGNPGETWETVEETKKLLKECPPDFWSVSVFTPFPGSATWADPEKYGIKILTRDLTQYAMVGRDYKGIVVSETEEMTKEDIERARDELIDLCLSLSGPTYDLKEK
jgi:anaerobic magnesium-protoporphyrin IX monomethyl ester cyclase